MGNVIADLMGDWGSSVIIFRVELNPLSIFTSPFGFILSSGLLPFLLSFLDIIFILRNGC